MMRVKGTQDKKLKSARFHINDLHNEHLILPIKYKHSLETFSDNVYNKNTLSWKFSESLLQIDFLLFPTSYTSSLTSW